MAAIGCVFLFFPLFAPEKLFPRSYALSVPPPPLVSSWARCEFWGGTFALLRRAFFDSHCLYEAPPRGDVSARDGAGADASPNGGLSWAAMPGCSLPALGNVIGINRRQSLHSPSSSPTMLMGGDEEGEKSTDSFLHAF